jgi:phosphoribosyl-ATP pyrophosphohydrolase
MLYGAGESQVKKRSARRTPKPRDREPNSRAPCETPGSRPVADASVTGDKGAMREKDRAGAMFTLDELARTIDQRADASAAETSYTRSLLEKGAAHCARKFGEEAIELAIAAAALDDSAVRAEAADVLYHLLVVLRARGVTLLSVMNELDRRSQRSGHEEKASRTT